MRIVMRMVFIEVILLVNFLVFIEVIFLVNFLVLIEVKKNHEFSSVHRSNFLRECYSHRRRNKSLLYRVFRAIKEPLFKGFGSSFGESVAIYIYI